MTNQTPFYLHDKLPPKHKPFLFNVFRNIKCRTDRYMNSFFPNGIASWNTTIMIRFLMYEYEIQVANVKWNNCYSMEFNIKNGVKQGAVLSALLYCVYVEGLFHILRKSRLGCWINGEFVGTVGYADDNMLLSPTLDGLQRIINICELYAAEHNLTFSTNENANKCKTKCMAILKKGRNLKPLILGGHCLPMVNSVRHLGNKIENKLDGMRQDMREKRGHDSSKRPMNYARNSHSLTQSQNVS